MSHRYADQLGGCWEKGVSRTVTSQLMPWWCLLQTSSKPGNSEQEASTFFFQMSVGRPAWLFLGIYTGGAGLWVCSALLVILLATLGMFLCDSRKAKVKANHTAYLKSPETLCLLTFHGPRLVKWTSPKSMYQRNILCPSVRGREWDNVCRTVFSSITPSF